MCYRQTAVGRPRPVDLGFQTVNLALLRQLAALPNLESLSLGESKGWNDQLALAFCELLCHPNAFPALQALDVQGVPLFRHSIRTRVEENGTVNPPVETHGEVRLMRALSARHGDVTLTYAKWPITAHVNAIYQPFGIASGRE